MWLLASLLPAQELVWERLGVPEQTQLGDQVVTLGDVNGDGYDDLLHMAWTFHLMGAGFLDKDLQLWILSGKDGSTLRIRPRVAPDRPYERIAAAGDMDGDGIPDYAVRVGERSGRIAHIVQVCSGKDDSVLWQAQGASWNDHFGFVICGRLDLDGDGKLDIVTNAPRETSYGALYAYGNDGTLLYRLAGSAQLPFPFMRVAKVGDVDSDGADDFVAGTFDVSGAGAGAVLSGRTGSLLVKGVGSRFPYSNVGQWVDGAGDYDGDGVPDFVASSTGCGGGLGVVMLFSGSSGQELRAWTAPVGGCSGFGGVVRSGGVDMDQDGVPDIVVGATEFPVSPTRPDKGAVLILSGRHPGNSTYIHAVYASDPSGNNRPHLGVSLDVLPPQPGTSFPSLVVPERDYWIYTSQVYTNVNLYRGRIRMLRGSPTGVSVTGSACQGSTAAPPRIGIHDFGPAGARFHLSGAPPATSAFFLLGLSNTSWSGLRLPMQLDPLGLRGCTLYVSVDLVAGITTGGAGIDAGYGHLDVPIPLATQGQGIGTLYGQWLMLGSGNTWPGAVSAAMSWRH